MSETTSRVLQLLGLLQSRRVWSGEQLAERLGVTGRSVRRDVERLRDLGYPVHASLPNEYFALHRVVTLGQPLGSDCDLGRAIENVATKLSGTFGSPKKNGAAARELKPALA